MDYDRYRTLPNALKQYRQEQRLSQREVARLLGLKNASWISHWEHGNALPSLVSALRLSRIYQSSVGELFPELVEAIRRESEDAHEAGQ